MRRGACRFVALNDAPNVIAFERSAGDEKLLCLFNRAAQNARITLPESYANSEMLYGEAVGSGPRVYELRAKSVVVLRVSL